MADLIEAVKNELSVENIIRVAVHTPGVKINRSQFLKKELRKYYSIEVVNEAIRTNPAKAGVTQECVNTISKQIINYETTKVTGLSAAASIPGGLAAIGAAAADISSYFVFILRIVQQLAYLYGFDEIELNENSIYSETMNEILLFLGVMFGVQEANVALRKVADSLAKKVARNLANKHLTKGIVYPFIKRIASSVGIQLNKQLFADSVASFVPIVGSVLSGGLTFVMFRPCCMRLRRNLMQYRLSDPNFYQKKNNYE